MGLFALRVLSGGRRDAWATSILLNPTPFVRASPTPVPKLSPALYTANLDNTALSIFPLGANGNAPSVSGNSQLSSPTGIAYRSSEIYVANQSNESITVFAATANGSPSPIFVISGDKTGLDSPGAIGLDTAGNLYVANAGKGGGGKDSITEYAANARGNVAPIAEIAGAATRLSSPSGIALDASGQIYVANSSAGAGGLGSITVYSPKSTGNAAPIRTISGNLTRLSSLEGIAVDSSGNIYASSLGIEGSSGPGIVIFKAGSDGNVAPAFTIDGDCAGQLGWATGPIALDASGNIYVGGFDRLVFFGHDIIDFRQSGGCFAPGFTISGNLTGINHLAGIAVDSAGNVYETNQEDDSVGVFAVSDQPALPLATISTNNHLSNPTGVAVDAAGKIYVANAGTRDRGSDSITVYAAGSNAVNEPIATFGYSDADKSGFDDPSAITVDSDGKIYVANGAGGHDSDGGIAVFAAAANGDVAPIATISGSRSGDNTGLHDPVGLALDSSHQLYVLNTFGGPQQRGSITIYKRGADGNVAPIATIADGANSKTRYFNSPAGMAIDSDGNLYVTNDGKGGSVAIYAAGSTDSVAPKAVIGGTNTELNMPTGIAIASNGDIYVANRAGDVEETEDEEAGTGPPKITVYRRGSSGDAAPIATISGPLTGLAHPGGIAIGPANLSVPPSKMLAAYDWSVKASPSLVTQPPPLDVVGRFVLSTQISFRGSLQNWGGGDKLCSFRFADLRHDGVLSLIGGGRFGNPSSCGDPHSDSFSWAYVVDRAGSSFEMFEANGPIGTGDDVSTGIVDLRHDGNLELIVRQRFGGITNRCIASVPLIYAWRGNGYMNISGNHFQDFYQHQLDTLNKLIAALPSGGSFYDQGNGDCLRAEADTIERFLGHSPNAGLDSALQLTSSADKWKRYFGISLLAWIGTPEALQDLEKLGQSPDRNTSQLAKDTSTAVRKGLFAIPSELRRLR